MSIASVSSATYTSPAANIKPSVSGPGQSKSSAEEKAESPAQESAEHESGGSGLDVTA